MTDRLLTYQPLIESLSEAQKAFILNDLFLCLAQQRLVDCAFGWELTKGGKGIRPRPTGLHRDINPVAGYPTWISLPTGFRSTTPPLLPLTIRGEIITDD